MTNEVPDFSSLYDLTQKNPDRTLNLAIILQALLDMSKPKEPNETNETALQRDQASAWVFASVGVTCENFESVCQMAGVQPAKARSFAYKVLNADNKDFLRKRIRNVLRGEDDKEKRFDI